MNRLKTPKTKHGHAGTQMNRRGAKPMSRSVSGIQIEGDFGEMTKARKKLSVHSTADTMAAILRFALAGSRCGEPPSFFDCASFTIPAFHQLLYRFDNLAHLARHLSGTANALNNHTGKANLIKAPQPALAPQPVDRPHAPAPVLNVSRRDASRQTVRTQEPVEKDKEFLITENVLDLSDLEHVQPVAVAQRPRDNGRRGPGVRIQDGKHGDGCQIAQVEIPPQDLVGAAGGDDADARRVEIEIEASGQMRQQDRFGGAFDKQRHSGKKAAGQARAPAAELRAEEPVSPEHDGCRQIAFEGRRLVEKGEQKLRSPVLLPGSPVAQPSPIRHNHRVSRDPPLVD